MNDRKRKRVEIGRCDWSGICLPQVDFHPNATEHHEPQHTSVFIRTPRPFYQESRCWWRQLPPKMLVSCTIVKTELQIHYSDRCTVLKLRIARIARWNSFRDAFSSFSHQCYQVTRCVQAEIWLKPFTLSNVHGIKTDGRCGTGANTLKG